jgi:hypothetical protein
VVALAILLPSQCTITAPLPVAQPTLSELVGTASIPSAALAERASDVLANRCVACHGCYDAPCQLRLQAHEGLRRGGSKLQVYDQTRLSDAQPTRLGIDGHSVDDWRAMGFHSVLAEAGKPDRAIVARLLALSRTNPPRPNAPLPEALSLDPGAAICPTEDEIDIFAASTPHGGMPYGVAPLADSEFQTLAAWVLAGAPPPPRREPPPPAITTQIAAWENFLNGQTRRERLTARYLFEHLFHARLHFDGDAPDRFFRLIRAETASGAAEREIATRRPFDDPGGAFRYRLIEMHETPVHKDLNIYALSPERMARLRALFLEPDWDIETLPPYGTEAGGNPFLTFAPIPVEGRYRFLLDDALFFVRGFVRGPVCHGQIATDVIEDRFWVSFLDPAWDLSVTDPGFLAEAAPLLSLTAAEAEGLAILRLWPATLARQGEWLDFRDARHAASPLHRGGLRPEALWRGEDARLTIVRHFDNAAVRSGLIGMLPETAWVIDYPLFERIHYDLVAAYDVFGNVEHQLATRLSMDHLRREGEDQFLAFLPPETRRRLHDAWYRGPLADLHAAWTERRAQDARSAAIAFETDNPEQEFLAAWVAHDAAQMMDLNRCAAPCGESTTAQALSVLAGTGGRWLQFLPDLTVLRVRQSGGEDSVFSLVRDKAHTNVALLLGESLRREPEADRLTVVRGVVGAYPNFHFDVAEADLAAFLDRVAAMRAANDWMALIDRFGVRRSSPRFWQTYDAIGAATARQTSVAPGLLDLGRYRDPRPDDPLE